MVLLAILALSGGLLLLLNAIEKKTEEESSGGTDRTVIFEMDVSKMERIQWTYRGETFAIVKDGEVWRLEDDPSIELYQTACLAMANSLELITTGKFIADPDYAAMGLDEPSSVVTLRADGREYTFTFGNENSTGGMYYLLYEGRVSMVISYEKTVFNKSLISLTGGEEPYDSSLPYTGTEAP